jgi:hypothetical protein|uniref:MobC family plasmid mobilization relaxosome protein n=1 Tax=Citrobacter braakii TaxID=57706 RepID=UPI002342ED6D|nr:MobC family plasmid mobilization relaxosome protein [Citrobacter braakii]WBU75728.1 MobC family plasmid mobilization relaxosome protein [Citrobacter braakii]
MADKETLDARAAFRLPADVLAEWHTKAKAGGYKNLSDFLRSAVDSRQVTGLPTPAAKKRSTDNGCDPALIQQLAKIGNNLNQIARALNECRKAGDVVEVVEVLAVLRSNEAAIAELFPKLPKPPAHNKGAADAH